MVRWTKLNQLWARPVAVSVGASASATRTTSTVAPIVMTSRSESSTTLITGRPRKDVPFLLPRSSRFATRTEAPRRAAPRPQPEPPLRSKKGDGGAATRPQRHRAPEELARMSASVPCLDNRARHGASGYGSACGTLASGSERSREGRNGQDTKGSSVGRSERRRGQLRQVTGRTTCGADDSAADRIVSAGLVVWDKAGLRGHAAPPSAVRFLLTHQALEFSARRRFQRRWRR